MQPTELQISAIPGLPEVVAGDNLGRLIVEAIHSAAMQVKEKDVFVVAQKVVSKAEGRVVPLSTIQPSSLAHAWSDIHDKEAAVVEVVLGQTRRLVRMERGILIVETQQGYVCANAGVDTSNAPPGTVTLLPEDPDSSAARIRDALQEQFGVPLGVIISDTFGRPWREGLVNVALGVAGLDPFLDYRGYHDGFGRRLHATVIAVADEIASAAELVMGKTRRVPVALVRGFDYREAEGWGRNMIRPSEQDLFR
ncbi:MAG: coenzyme F420-0:L-glutamate ligase [Acidobacteria bacterium]|nr:coenzyme F420-0:L-glutamate ligase [Acidobacteriota bacterium]